MDDIKERLIEVAQNLIQRRGYNGFSYRDIAAEVGIRSASIHYHFPTKADLGVSVAARYSEQFLGKLHRAAEETDDTSKLLKVFASLFRESLIQEGRICLCGMLGAEVESLPREVAVEVKRFFDASLDWLTGVLRRGKKSGDAARVDTVENEAATIFATLEGAMIIAKGAGNLDLFDKIVDTTLRPYG